MLSLHASILTPSLWGRSASLQLCNSRKQIAESAISSSSAHRINTPNRLQLLCRIRKRKLQTYLCNVIRRKYMHEGKSGRLPTYSLPLMRVWNSRKPGKRECLLISSTIAIHTLSVSLKMFSLLPDVRETCDHRNVCFLFKIH